MDLIPVLDLMNGQVVRGIAGDRRRYQPNVSVLVDSSDPIATRDALVAAFQPPMLYVADLDGIASGRMQTELLESLAKRGVPLAVDAGADSPEKVRALLNCGVEKVILGLETLSDLTVTKNLVAEFGEDRILFSLDLKEGIPLEDGVTSRHPIEIVSRVISYGVRHLIVLDLASIGINSGVQTGSLCHAIKRRWPELVLWTGGGVRSIIDLHRISLCRVDGVMVASALHDGQITPADWQSFLQLLSDGDTMQMMDA